jgi:hypothetical protein
MNSSLRVILIYLFLARFPKQLQVYLLQRGSIESIASWSMRDEKGSTQFSIPKGRVGKVQAGSTCVVRLMMDSAVVRFLAKDNHIVCCQAFFVNKTSWTSQQSCRGGLLSF